MSRHYQSPVEITTLLLQYCEIHAKNLQLLMTEIYKTMEDIFMDKIPQYSPRNGSQMQLPKVRTTTFGIATKLSNLAQFKNRIKKWKGGECVCKLCRYYIAQVGFLD